MPKNSRLQNEMFKRSLDMVILTAGRQELVRGTRRWRPMTRAIGLMMGEEGGAQ